MFRKALSCAVALTDSSSLAAISRRCAAISARARSIRSRNGSADLVGSAGGLAGCGCAGPAEFTVPSAGALAARVGLAAASVGLVGSAGTWAWTVTGNNTQAQRRKNRLTERKNPGDRLRFTRINSQQTQKASLMLAYKSS